MNALPVDRIRVLISFHYYRKKDIADLTQRFVVAGVKPDIFADSGAFSAWMHNASVSVGDYAKWLHKWGNEFCVYANLDVIDNPEATRANQRSLEAEGLAPLPVWHVRSPRNIFLDLCEEYRYVAIGGMVGTHWKRLMPHLVWALREARRTDTAVHGLGLTSVTPLSSLPFFSVDSTTWQDGYRYGHVRFWDAKQRKTVNAHLGDVDAWTKHAAATRRLGFSPKRFATRVADRHEIAALAVKSLMLQEQWVRSRLGVVRLPKGDKPECHFGDDDGCKIFMAEVPHGPLIAATEHLAQQGATSG